MTPRSEAVEQPFERYPWLASWIEKLANRALNLSLGEWSIFIDALNAAIVEAERRAPTEEASAQPVKTEPFFNHRGKEIGQRLVDDWPPIEAPTSPNVLSERDDLRTALRLIYTREKDFIQRAEAAEARATKAQAASDVMREALEKIAKNEVDVYDEDLRATVVASRDADEQAEIAAQAIASLDEQASAANGIVPPSDEVGGLNPDGQLSGGRNELALTPDSLRAFAKNLEALAFKMPPPNPWTPQFVMMAQALTHELNVAESRARAVDHSGDANDMILTGFQWNPAWRLWEQVAPSAICDDGVFATHFPIMDGAASSPSESSEQGDWRDAAAQLIWGLDPDGISIDLAYSTADAIRALPAAPDRGGV